MRSCCEAPLKNTLIRRRRSKVKKDNQSEARAVPFLLRLHLRKYPVADIPTTVRTISPATSNKAKTNRANPLRLAGNVGAAKGGISIVATMVAAEAKPTRSHQLKSALASACLSCRVSLGTPYRAPCIAAHQVYFRNARDAPRMRGIKVSQYQGRRIDLEPGAAIPLCLTGVKGKSLRFLLGNPFVGAGLEQIERKSSAVEHFVVESADVELRS